MPAARIAVDLDAYRTDLRSALERAAADGFRVVEASALAPEFDPSQFGQTARRHLRKLLDDFGLSLDALSVRFSGLGLADPGRAAQRAERLQSALALASDLRVARATVAIGGWSDDASRGLAAEMLAMLGDAADRSGVAAAALDPRAAVDVLAEHVRGLRCPALGVAVDTAAITPPSAGDAALVRAAYVRDVRRTGGQEVEEVALGRGDVDLREWVSRLESSDAGAVLVLSRSTPGAVDAMRAERDTIESVLGR